MHTVINRYSSREQPAPVRPCLRCVLLGGLAQAAQPEVCDPCTVVGVQQYVVRLQVAVQHAHLARIGNGTAAYWLEFTAARVVTKLLVWPSHPTKWLS